MNLIVYDCAGQGRKCSIRLVARQQDERWCLSAVLRFLFNLLQQPGYRVIRHSKLIQGSLSYLLCFHAAMEKSITSRKTR